MRQNWQHKVDALRRDLDETLKDFAKAVVDETVDALRRERDPNLEVDQYGQYKVEGWRPFEILVLASSPRFPDPDATFVLEVCLFMDLRATVRRLSWESRAMDARHFAKRICAALEDFQS